MHIGFAPVNTAVSRRGSARRPVTVQPADRARVRLSPGCVSNSGQAAFRDGRLEPFSGVEIHMEMDMEWKWMQMGHNW